MTEAPKVEIFHQRALPLHQRCLCEANSAVYTHKKTVYRRCRRAAMYKVNGKKLCLIHAGISTLETLTGQVKEPQRMPLVIIESPFAGDIGENICYARACVADSIQRGEAPIAFHLLYTQDGILNDRDPADRELGITCSEQWYWAADLVVAYTDLGVSPGMRHGMAVAARYGLPIIDRKIAWSSKCNSKSISPTQENA